MLNPNDLVKKGRKLFDKFVHLSIPFLISILAFLIVYVIYRTGRLKGSLVEDAYTDTMNDLVADMIGSLLGIFFAIKYIDYHKDTPRMKQMITEVKKEILE